MEKYFKIGEISRLYHIGVDSLRYYEEIGIISPKRAESGYRLYSVNDIWRLNVIRDLRELGFSMTRIKQYLDYHNTESTLALLQEEQDAIHAKMQTLMQLQANVEHRMQTIRSAQQRPLGQVFLEEYPDRHYFSIPQGYSDEHEMDVLIKQLVNIDPEHFYVIGNNQIGTVISLQEATTQGRVKYQSVFLIDENGESCLPAGKYLSVRYRGAYSQCPEQIHQLLGYAREHQLTPSGNFLEILWIDNHTTSDIHEQITELQVLVE